MLKPESIPAALSTGPKHHFFGYYGINPWNRSMQYHLALETDFHEHRPSLNDIASVGLVDRKTNTFTKYAETSAFNLQQGSMMHWIDVGFGEEFTFNDWENEKLVSRAVHLETGDLRTIEGAIAAASPIEPLAIGLNFARMAHCRAVVGYANDSVALNLDPTPNDDGLFLLNLQSGESRLVISIAEVCARSNDKQCASKRTWFNHVLFNTDGSRVLFFCRYKDDEGMHTSLWTVNPDGTNLECQIPFGNRISHFAWRDPRRILISSDCFGEMQFLEFTDRQRDFASFGAGQLPRDGHACYSPDSNWLVCDTYPQGSERLAALMLYNVNHKRIIYIGRYYSEKRFTGDVRCDLHPRWSSDGRFITFDSVHEGTRQIYLVDVTKFVH